MEVRAGGEVAGENSAEVRRDACVLETRIDRVPRDCIKSVLNIEEDSHAVVSGPEILADLGFGYVDDGGDRLACGVRSPEPVLVWGKDLVGIQLL